MSEPVNLDKIQPLQTFRHQSQTWMKTRTPQQIGKQDGYTCVNLGGIFPGGALWLDKDTIVNPGPIIKWQVL